MLFECRAFCVCGKVRKKEEERVQWVDTHQVEQVVELLCPSTFKTHNKAAKNTSIFCSCSREWNGMERKKWSVVLVVFTGFLGFMTGRSESLL